MITWICDHIQNQMNMRRLDQSRFGSATQIPLLWLSTPVNFYTMWSSSSEDLLELKFEIFSSCWLDAHLDSQSWRIVWSWIQNSSSSSFRTTMAIPIEPSLQTKLKFRPLNLVSVNKMVRINSPSSCAPLGQNIEYKLGLITCECWGVDGSKSEYDLEWIQILWA